MIVSNPLGSITSRLATVYVGLPPAMANKPSEVTTRLGGTVNLSVGVTGTGPLSFKWRLNGTNLPNDQLSVLAGPWVLQLGDGALGDGGLAVGAALKKPQHLAFDRSGNLYFTDFNDHRVRMVDTNGIIQTVAGIGIAGFSGDGGPATKAQLNYPSGIAVSPAGEVYLTDTINLRVRKIDVNGIISTVAGGNSACTICNGVPATYSSLFDPRDLAFDPAGNLLIADWGLHQVRRVDTNGIISTVAGNGLAGYSGDGGPATNATLAANFSITEDVVGNLFIAEWSNHVIRKVGLDGVIRTVAGNGSALYNGDGGPATNAAINDPFGVAVDPAGNIFILNYWNSPIRKVDASGIISTVVPLMWGRVWTSTGIVLDDKGQLYVIDGSAGRIVVIHADGSLAAVAGGRPGDGAPLPYLKFDPSGIAIDVAGNLFIADQVNARVRQINRKGIFSTLVGPDPASAPLTYFLKNPRSVAFTGDGDLLIADQFNNQILKANGSTDLAVLRSGLKYPAGVGHDQFGNALVVDSGNGRIFAVGPDNRTTRLIKIGNYTPVSVVADRQGNIFCGNYSTIPVVYRIGPAGDITRVAGGGANWPGDGGPALQASLGGKPNSFDYVATGVAIDLDDNLIIADTSGGRVRRVDHNGIIWTIAGGGKNAPVEGISATNASIGFPADVKVNPFGDLIIASQARSDGVGGGEGTIYKVGGLPTLGLTNVSASNAGDYQVVVSSPYGSITSAVARVTLTLPPLKASLAAGALQLSFSGISGTPYVLEVTSSLSPPALWQPVSTNIAGADGGVVFDPSILVGDAARYYRIVLP